MNQLFPGLPVGNCAHTSSTSGSNTVIAGSLPNGGPGNGFANDSNSNILGGYASDNNLTNFSSSMEELHLDVKLPSYRELYEKHDSAIQQVLDLNKVIASFVKEREEMKGEMTKLKKEMEEMRSKERFPFDRLRNKYVMINNTKFSLCLPQGMH
jgi:hypothetical protein